MAKTDLLKLFSFTTKANCDDSLVSIPSFEFRSQPFQSGDDWFVRAHIKAYNRREAVKLINRAGLYCRDLNDGKFIRSQSQSMWKCPVCGYVMTEEQSKLYKSCPSGVHFSQHVRVPHNAL